MRRWIGSLPHSGVTLRSVLARVAAQEDVNFLLTNRIPRRLLTRAMGRLSRVEQPLVSALSIRVWRMFCDVDLGDAAQTRFRSLHEAFVRELRPGARPVDPDPGVLVSPCDAILGAHGPVRGREVFQIKGFPYDLRDLLHDPALCERYRDGTFVTLRLTAGMYHRFHAPHDATIEAVTYISGDTWNVNPIALRRIERLFCRNERAVVRLRLAASDAVVTLVPVAAILVASLRLHCLGPGFDLRQGGPRTIPCERAVARGDELGWFEHGSTIIVLAPEHFEFADHVAEGVRVRAGETLLRKP